MAFVLLSAIRNEGPFLLDWIAYHRAIGFEKIVIVSNDCDDGSTALLDRLSRARVITHITQTIRPGMGPQASAVSQAEELNVLRDGDWGIFLDADEYLNIHVGQGLVTDLADVIDKADAVGMLIAWRLFGDSGHERFPGSYLREDYTECENLPSFTQFKTFFRKGPVAAGFSPWLHRCRVHPKAGRPRDFLTGSGSPISVGRGSREARRHKRWLENGEEPFSHLSNTEISYKLAQINHYIVRDPFSFVLKQRRGRGHVVAGGANRRHTANFYRLHNRNEAVDTSILRWSDATAQQKRWLVKEVGLQPALKMIAHKYETQEAEPLKTSDKAITDIPFPLTFPSEVAGFVKDKYRAASSILEYGSGGSTLLAAELGVRCLSVESDLAWCTKLNAALETKFPDGPTARAVHTDIGPTKMWGYPADTSRWSNYWRYPLAVWQNDPAIAPSLVLIDGRMRKACFAATLLNIQAETTILFDDYLDRPSYHEVADFVRPVRIVDRMAEFIVKPGMIDQAAFIRILPWFSQLK